MSATAGLRSFSGSKITLDNMTSDAFVPFASALKAGRVPGKAAPEFRPLKAEAAAPVPAPDAPVATLSTAAHSHTPIIQVIKEEGMVKEIKVQCSCGQVIEISCQY